MESIAVHHPVNSGTSAVDPSTMLLQALLPGLMGYTSSTLSGFTNPSLSPRTQIQKVLGIPSTGSGLADADKVPTLYPHITDWLHSLDKGPQGHDQQNFAQYGPELSCNGYIHIFQLADEAGRETGAWNLVDICNGMTLGVARLLIKYAKVECGSIEKREADRLRVLKLTSPQYYN